MKRKALIRRGLCIALSALVITSAFPAAALNVLAASPEQTEQAGEPAVDAGTGEETGSESKGEEESQIQNGEEESQTGSSEEESKEDAGQEEDSTISSEEEREEGTEEVSDLQNEIDAVSGGWEENLIAAEVVNGCIWKLYSDGTLVIRDYTEGITESNAVWGFRNYSSRITKVDMDISEGINLSNMFNGFGNMTEATVKIKNATGSADYMFNGCTNLASLDVSGFNTSGITSIKEMFDSCQSLKTLDLSSFDTGNVTDMHYLFLNCISLESINLGQWNTSKVTNMNNMFSNCNSLKQIDVSNWDVSNVNYMSNMFKNCYKLEEIDISKWNVSKVTNMEGMFYHCSSLKTLDLSELETPKLTSAYYMFEGCSSLEVIKLGKFNTSKVKDFSSIFDGCSSLKEIDLTKLDTSSATSFYRMFYGCSSLETMDLSKFNTSKVTNMIGMFFGCSSLSTLDLSGFDTSAVTTMKEMFTNCSNLKSVDLSSFDTSKVVNMYCMFNSCTKLEKLDLSNFKTDKLSSSNVSEFLTSCITLKEIKTIPNLGSSFNIALPFEMKDEKENKYTALPKGLTESVTLKIDELVASGYTNGYKWTLTSDGLLTIRDDDGLNTENVTTSFSAYKQRIISVDMNVSKTDDLYKMFYSCRNLQTAIVQVEEYTGTTLGNMFESCYRLKSVDLSGLDASKVTNMNGMFAYCYALEEVNLSGMGTSSVKEMANMFYDCSALKQLDLTGLDTSNVTNMYGMFHSCTSLRDLNIKDFNTSKVTNMAYMFYKCESLETLDVAGFDTSNVATMYYMFYNCKKLKSLDVTNFVTNYCGDFDHIFNSCESLESLDLSNWVIKTTYVRQFFNGCKSLTRIKTVQDLSANILIALPFEMYDADGVPYSIMPTELSEGIWLAKEGVSVPVEVKFEQKNYNFVPGKEIQLKLMNLPANVKETDFTLTSLNTDIVTVDENRVATAVAKGTTRIVATYENYSCSCFVVVKDSDFVVSEIADQYYTGTQIKPVVEVRDNKTLLKEGVHYTLKYVNNTNAADKTAKKAPAVIITGKGNYTGKITKTFTILPYNANGALVEAKLSQEFFVETSKVQKPVPVITFNGKKLTYKKDYTYSYPDTTEGAYQKEGSYKVHVDFINNFSGSKDLTCTIKNGLLISKAKIQKIPDMNYTGAQVKPVPVVTYNNVELTPGIDFTCTYSKNIPVGTATIKITGIGQYFGTTHVTFKIVGTDISKAEVIGLEDCVYTGSAVAPKIDVSLDGGETFLSSSKDYKIIYENCHNVGTAKMTIIGTGGYQGTIKKTYKITPYDIEKNEGVRIRNLPTEGTVVPYTKKGAQLPVAPTFYGKAMDLSKDVTVTYSNNKKVALSTDEKAPTVTIKGKGNFKGTITIAYTIRQENLSDISITVPDVVYQNKAGKFVSSPVIVDASGQKLKAGTDYDKNLVYKCNGFVLNPKTHIVPAGSTITVTLKGIGYYTGTVEISYRVTKASVKSVSATVKPKTYTGSGITLKEDDIKVKLGKQTLKYGTDYVLVNYSNNVSSGTASVTVKGIGNYCGEKTIKFKILPKNFLDFLSSFII